MCRHEKKLRSTVKWMLQDLPNRLGEGYRKICQIDIGKIQREQLREIVNKNQFLGNIPKIRSLLPELFHGLWRKSDITTEHKRIREESSEVVEKNDKRLKAEEMQALCLRLDTPEFLVKIEGNNSPENLVLQQLELDNPSCIIFPYSKRFIKGAKKMLACWNLETKIFRDLGHFHHYGLDCGLMVLQKQIICLHQVLNPKGKNPYGALKAFDLQKLKSWKGVGPNMDSRRNYKATIVGKRIYVIGGDCDLVEWLNLGPLFTKNELWGEWESARRGSLRGRGFGVCTVLDRIYVLGGQVDNEDGSSYVRPDVAFLNTANMQWTGVPPMRKSRMDFAVAVSGYKIFALGGRSYSKSQEEIVRRSVEMYDPKEGWTRISSMLKPRSNFNAAIYKGYLYAIGGDNLTSGDALQTAERLNLETGIWEEWSQLPANGFYQDSVVGRSND